jgi:hypothetical protein
MVKYWSNIGQIPAQLPREPLPREPLQREKILVKYWSNTGQILVECRRSFRMSRFSVSGSAPLPGDLAEPAGGQHAAFGWFLTTI